MILELERVDSDDAYREDMRHRCITDHFFLAQVMGFNDFVPRIHQPVVDLYFPKNPQLSIAEQHPIKKRMHLDPRDTFKTTMGRVDTMQWILAFPQTATIVNESATQKLAEKISKGTAEFLCRYRAPRPGLLKLFPELAVDKWPFHNDVEEWNTPNHDNVEIDPTMAYSSPKSTHSGWHPWIYNPDDMVETINSGLHASEDSRERIKSRYHTNKNTVRGGGYINMRGTRYHPFDLYGDMLKEIDLKNPERSGWKLLIRTAMIVRNGKQLVPGEFPEEREVVLQFPELPALSYEILREKFYDNYESFMCQQMNDPKGGHVSTFPEKLYHSCEIEASRIPAYGGETFICWRLPYGGKTNMAKYSEGVAARVVDGKVYILDCWQGIYQPTNLAERMVAAYKKHQASVMMILETPGSEYMQAHIRNESARKNVSMRPIRWVWWDESDERRNEAIKQLEPLMNVGRLMFSTDMTKSVECRQQFVHYGLVPENGIIECISKFSDLVPLSQLRANMEQEEIEAHQRIRENALMNHFIEQQGMPQVDENARKVTAHIQAVQRSTTIGLPPLPGGLDG